MDLNFYLKPIKLLTLSFILCKTEATVPTLLGPGLIKKDNAQEVYFVLW